MCGDIEEEEGGNEHLYARFLQSAHQAIHDAVDHRGGGRDRLSEEEGPISDGALHAYMDGLFADVLKACVKDGARIAESGRYRLLSAQAVVLARLAGFFAGHLSLHQDPLRSAMESLMAGYSEQDDGDPHEHEHHHHHG
jgi:hypothetical protein